MRVTGRYVATVAIDFEFDDSLPGVKSFEEIKDSVENGGMTEIIRYLTNQAVQSIGSAYIEQEFAEMMKWE